MRKNDQVWHRKKKSLPNKNQDWTLFVNIYPCEQPFWKTNMLSLSTQYGHEMSVQTSEQGMHWFFVITEADAKVNMSRL